MTYHTEIPSTVSWYAVWTKSRQEKAASARLASAGISHYLPLCSEMRTWSDRKQLVDMPLFPGYVFVQLDVRSEGMLKILRIPGIVGFVGNSLGPLPIPDRQIESVRTVILCGTKCRSTEYLKEGDRVRVVRGALAGIEGSLVRIGSKAQLIISMEMIGRSVLVGVANSDVEPVCRNPRPSSAIGRSPVAIA